MQSLFNLVEIEAVGRPIWHEHMALFPIEVSGARLRQDVLLLEEALRSPRFQLDELPRAKVPEILARNRSHTPVLLIEGQVVLGAKQHRVLNASILAGPGKTVVPVSCVQRGRWSARSSCGFSSGPHSSPRMRAKTTHSVSHSLCTRSGYIADQGEVWEEVARKSSALGVRSGSESLNAVFEQRHKDLAAYQATCYDVPEARGLLAVIGGRPVSLEIFGSARILRSIYPKLVEGYILDAIEIAGRVVKPRRRVAQPFLRRLAGAGVRACDSPGLGEDLRIEGRGVVGSALVHEGQLLHLSAFGVRG